MESVEVRREWLRCGGSYSAAARALGMTRQNVEQHVKRANRIAPLTYQSGEQADRAAVSALLRATLEAAGVRVP